MTSLDYLDNPFSNGCIHALSYTNENLNKRGKRGPIQHQLSK